MRLIYIIGLLTVIGTGALWCGWYGMARRRIAAMLAAVSILAGGVLLLLAVLPDYSFYGTTVTHNFAAGKNVALTFDDGPYPPYTDELLKILEQRQVKATFFMVAENAEKHPELVAKIAAQGHEIALHALKHRDFLKLSLAEQQKRYCCRQEDFGKAEWTENHINASAAWVSRLGCDRYTAEKWSDSS